MISRRWWNLMCWTIVIGMVVLFGESVYMLVDTVDNALLLSKCSVLILSMFLCMILFGSMFADESISSPTLYIMCMVSVMYLVMFLDLNSIALESVGGHDAVREALWYLEDATYPIVIVLFGCYVSAVLDVPERSARSIVLMMCIMMVCRWFMLSVNLLQPGTLFSFEDGHYTPTDREFMLMIPTVAIGVFAASVSVAYSKTVRQGFTFIMYAFAPVMCAFAAPYEDGSVLVYAASSISILFIFGSVYLVRGVTLAKNEAEMAEQRVAIMVSRIEPGFLDEALHSIMNIGGTPEETRRAIGQFSTYLNENVSTISKKVPIPFEEELRHVQTYTTLEKLRFKEKLNIVFEIHDTDFRIPAMTVQMIVENAIKHGITQRESGGTVIVLSEEMPDCHRVTVRDDGVGFDVTAPRDTSRSHIGLDNLIARLDEMVGGTFEVRSTIGEGTVAVVTIPKNRG